MPPAVGNSLAGIPAAPPTPPTPGEPWRLLALALLAGGGIGALSGGGYALRSAGRKTPSYEGGMEIDPPPVQKSANAAPNFWQQSTANMPTWAYPTAALAGVGSTALLNHLITSLVDSRRMRQTEDELESAKGDYEKALTETYSPDKLKAIGKPKTASADDTLARCFSLIKGATVAGPAAATPVADYLPKTPGHWTLAALLAAAGMYGAHRFSRDRDDNKLYQDALQRKALMSSLRNPPELYVHPEG